MSRRTPYSPIVASDGTAYFGGGDGNIYAFKEGQVKWTVPISGSCQGLARDGTVYVFSYTDYKLYALDPAGGATKWTYNGSSQPSGQMALSISPIPLGSRPSLQQERGSGPTRVSGQSRPSWIGTALSTS